MQIKDLDILLEKILLTARSFTNADAGSIYIKENNKLKFKYTQNDTLQRKLEKGKKLIYSTFSIPIDNKSIAGFVAMSGKILNIPDVYELSSLVPYSFDRKYDALSGYRTKSMLTIPLKDNRGEIVGVLQLINARDEKGKIIPFLSEDEPYIISFANNAAIAIERAEMTRTIILRMIKMAELRDPKETGGHVNRVASYAVEIYDTWATKRGINQEQIEKNKDLLRIAAMLHDVGKVAISDTILKKPARLTPEEYEIMKQHTFLGARLFSDKHSDFDEVSYIVALNHHEKWDGTGYPGHINPETGKPLPGYETPDGTAKPKKGEEIPPFGRIVALCDVYDALSSKRVYKSAWSEEDVLAEIRKDSGKYFDPEMVEAFFFSLDVIKSISERYPDEG
ncbi:MAG: HD domain-containing protein [Proteobacteria bacterium]|nr:HD domain-containing protein [Pseudomonadota bacterium]